MRTRRRAAPRDRFQLLLARVAKLREERSGIYDRHRREVADRIRAYTGWKGKDDMEIGAKATDKLADWERAELRRPVTDACLRRMTELKAEINWLETCLERIADSTRPFIGDEPRWFPYHEPIWASSYRTTCAGATYAEGSCLVTCDLLALEGFEARVVRIDEKHMERFQVEVRLHSELDVEMLKRSFAYSMKDWLRATLRRSLNPRVYNPFLPWGIEARCGLDHFGRDLKPANA